MTESQKTKALADQINHHTEELCKLVREFQALTHGHPEANAFQAAGGYFDPVVMPKVKEKDGRFTLTWRGQ